MAFSLPVAFGQGLNALDHHLREAMAAIEESAKAVHMRSALAVACDLLSSIDDRQLEGALADIAGMAKRDHVEALLREDKLFDHFITRIEDGILEVAGVGPRARETLLRSLRELRSIQRGDFTDSPLDFRRLAGDFRNVRTEVCSLKAIAIGEARWYEDQRQRDEAHTRILNSLGSSTIAVNAATGVAVAASLLFLPAVSVAACAASIAIGGIAQSRKPK